MPEKTRRVANGDQSRLSDNGHVGFDEGLACQASDLGGPYPRRIQYFPATGRVVRKLLTGGDRETIAREESEYAKRLAATKAAAGEVQLFGAKRKVAAGEVQLFVPKRKQP